LLLHGYPQTHHCWHRLAPALAASHTVVAADLRGYGASSVPVPDPRHEAYAKRRMAEDMVAAMAALGHRRFTVAGHDRGARVAYRMALDQPASVARLVALDVVPTAFVWRGMDWAVAIKSYHWPFLAQPFPLPETLIAANPAFYVDWTLASWTKANDLACFDATALAHYRALLAEPGRLRAVCEDYRAGATVDRELDEADLAAGHRIACPTLALWGSDYVGKSASSPREAWRQLASDVTGEGIDAGHFLAEENPQATLAALTAFLGRTAEAA
jgi:haloacetate dehalogenase